MLEGHEVTIVFVVFLVLACAVVGETMPHRRLGSGFSKLDYYQAYENFQKPISRKTAFWMKMRLLLLLVALAGMIGVLYIIL